MSSMGLLAIVLAATLLAPWPACRHYLQDGTCVSTRLASAQEQDSSSEIVPWRLEEDLGTAAAMAAAQAAAAGILPAEGASPAEQDGSLGHNSRDKRDNSRSRSRSHDNQSRRRTSHSNDSSRSSRRSDAEEVLHYWNSNAQEAPAADRAQYNSVANATASAQEAEVTPVTLRNRSPTVRNDNGIINSSKRRGETQHTRAAWTQTIPIRNSRSVDAGTVAETHSRPARGSRITSDARITSRPQRIISADIFGLEPAWEAFTEHRAPSRQAEGRGVSIKSLNGVSAVNGEYDPNDTGSSGNPVLRPSGFFKDREGIIDVDKTNRADGSGRSRGGAPAHRTKLADPTSRSSRDDNGSWSTNPSTGPRQGSGPSALKDDNKYLNRNPGEPAPSQEGDGNGPAAGGSKASGDVSRDHPAAEGRQEQQSRQDRDKPAGDSSNTSSTAGDRQKDQQPRQDVAGDRRAGESRSSSPAQNAPRAGGPNKDASQNPPAEQPHDGENFTSDNRTPGRNQAGPVGQHPPLGDRRRATTIDRSRGSSSSSNSASDHSHNRPPAGGAKLPVSSSPASKSPVLPPLANFGGSTSSGDIQQKQLSALLRFLPKLLVVQAETWPLVDGLLRDAPKSLSQWLAPNLATGVRDYTEFIDTRGYGFISVTMIRDDGTVYVTELYAYDAGLDLSVLPQLVSQLPRLKSFTCSNCMHNEAGPEAATQLPGALADAAPPTLAMLSLGGCKVQGSLPEAWSKWNTLEQLWVWDNALTGTIPASWKSMQKLKVFYAEQNQLTGDLPASWGSGSLPDNLSVYLHKNLKLSGTIPESWGRFSGVIDVSTTNVTGCVPDLLVDNVITDGTPEPCSPNDPNSELTALMGIKNGMQTMMGKAALASWNDQSSSTAGIACNSDGHVTALDMSFLKPSPKDYETPLPKLMQYVKRLKRLQVLNLASMALVGPLEEDKPLSDDMSALAADLTQLQVLNISSNPGITGSFPRLWAGLTSLQVLDVSDTGVVSKLPEVWASMQQLQVFRAAKTQVHGNLPGAWGMMKSIVEIDLTGCNISGPLPAQWADAAAMQAVAAAAVQAAQQSASAAYQDAQQAKITLLESKDQLKQPTTPAGVWSGNLGPQGKDPTRAASSPVAAQDIIAAAMDEYHAVMTQATQSQMIADTLQLALTKAASDMQLNGYGLGMMNLQVLKLANNQITGGLPVSYASFQRMRVLDLSGNDLSGPLPLEWAAMDNLQDLSLASNPKLSGVLPDYWARLTGLRRLDLANCGLSGRLPATWVSLQNAVSLNFSNNMFSGDVPEAWSFMTASKYKLRCLNLSGNSGLTNLQKVQEAWQENSAVKVVVQAGATC